MLLRHSPADASMPSTQTHHSPTLHTLSMSLAPTILARYPHKHATQAIHASTSSGPFLKQVKKFPPLKNCYFRNFDQYFDQETIIIYKFMIHVIQNLEHVHGRHHEHYCI